jgi:hypothetical protein
MIGMKVTGLAAMGAVICLTFVVACSGSQPTDPVGGDGNNQTTTEQDNKEGVPAGTNKDDKKSAGNDPAKNNGGTNGAPGTNGGNGTPPPNNQTPPNNNPPGGDPGGDPGGGNGENGQVGRVSVNEHCCFAGKYQRCPNSNACFGGFDINACLQGCSPFDPCFDECFDKMDKAGPPKGCDANAQPPAGVDCANGQINL